MPAIQPYILEPIWEQFCALLPEREVNHPLGCHRPRIPNRVVFEKLVQVLVFGCAYWRIADEKCSTTTLRRRRDEWIEAGVMDELREMALEAYDRFLGLELTELAVDCCITKAPCGGEMAGRSPVDRGKGGIKRSMVVDACGIPLGIVIAPANRHDSPLLDDTLNTLRPLGELPDRTGVHLDRAYDSDTTHQKLAARGLRAEISEKGKPAPITSTKRWRPNYGSSSPNVDIPTPFLEYLEPAGYELIGELPDPQERLAVIVDAAIRAVDRDERLDKDEKKKRIDWFEELKIVVRTFGIEGAKAVLRGDLPPM